jgi:hypothetical protein
MAKIHFDGVVDAVHYAPDGQVAWVRAYERRGPTFTDLRIIERGALVQRLKAGKKIYAGERIPYKASTFTLKYPFRLIQQDGKEILVTGDRVTDHDSLEGVPVI